MNEIQVGSYVTQVGWCGQKFKVSAIIGDNVIYINKRKEKFVYPISKMILVKQECNNM